MKISELLHSFFFLQFLEVWNLGQREGINKRYFFLDIQYLFEEVIIIIITNTFVFFSGE